MDSHHFFRGCSLLEKIWLVPEVEVNVPFDPILYNKQVLDAITLAVGDLDGQKSILWNNDVTYLNVFEGELETGYYSTPNTAGIQLRVEIERDDHKIRLTVKGAGPYYSKLPLQEALEQIQSAVIRRLDEAKQQIKRKQSQP